MPAPKLFHFCEANHEQEMMENAMNEIARLLKPFEAGPIEWVRIPMDKERSVYGLAVSVPLIPSGCSPEVLVDLISGIVSKLLYAVQEEALAGIQITFGKSEGDRMKRCYRIMIPTAQLAQAMIQ
jgi:hypothetical protein